ncbi:NADPH:quinone oxidoreductase family protein [Priestia taiwanensis]|uniref:Quinone oxidoreductase YhfP n=1 Tax=Priestia taiwanensis TaxID=1347902 RepID=A0A917ARR5_9BACI|nr:acryloyl-CoA reductase [Priestia taiwanensis]MBM7363248.1 putative YhdH/YhfP family quinone oxidoreductase [Priestia taiwanensis]GGE68882.1 putative quinone oxidoreductase YhfP [Priestia taiwanensis]
MHTFRALFVNKESNETNLEIRHITKDDLPNGNVTIRVHYSSVNYKDGLASIPNGNIVQSYPFIPGIDAAGIVEESADERFTVGDEVIVTSYELGVSHFGGYSEYIRVPADWVVPLPKGLSLKEAMILGTAGFTAALSVQQLEHAHVTPEKGDVLVTGATGGVGSIAVSMLAKKGYDVVASTGKMNEHDYLHTLGAKEILSREDVCPEKIRPLGRTRWAGAVDPVGGNTLAHVLSTTKYGGAVAVSGLTGGVSFQGSVFPFILRGVNLLGIDSVYCPMEVRQPLWERIATDLKPAYLTTTIVQEITLEQVPDTLASILKGNVRGRVVVNLM